MRSLVAIVALCVLSLFGSHADASAVRINLNKANQAAGPVKYSLQTSTNHGIVNVRLELPRKQTPLDYLWRIDIVMRKDDKTLLAVPLDTKLDGGNLVGDLLVNPIAMANTEIWIRTGEHAPLAETIYAIDLGSFK